MGARCTLPARHSRATTPAARHARMLGAAQHSISQFTAAAGAPRPPAPRRSITSRGKQRYYILVLPRWAALLLLVGAGVWLLRWRGVRWASVLGGALLAVGVALLHASFKAPNLKARWAGVCARVRVRMCLSGACGPGAMLTGPATPRVTRGARRLNNGRDDVFRAAWRGYQMQVRALQTRAR